MKVMNQAALCVTLLMTTSFAVQAAVALDRTRAVFNGTEKSISLNISNENKNLPYLAQTWLEDEHQQKLTAGPLVVTPPVQRLEPGNKAILRVMATPAAKQLPVDRESLFYFNLREVPPRSAKPNVLQIALQSKIKLFYRPAGIVAAPGAIWQDQLVLHVEGNGYRIENPTPYYITVIGLGATEQQSENGSFETVMIAPKSSSQVKSGTFATPHLTYINDYGGRPTLTFRCSGSRCVAK